VKQLENKKVPSWLKSLLSLHVGGEKNAISNAFGAAATPLLPALLTTAATTEIDYQMCTAFEWF